MSKKTQFDQVLNTLNEAFKADPVTMELMLKQYIPCNGTLADHPTIQVVYDVKDIRFKVGPLGLINGIVERLTGERVAAVYDDYSRLAGFRRYQAPKPVQKPAKQPVKKPSH